MIAQLDSKLVAQGNAGLITSDMKVLRVKSAPSGFTPNGWIPVPNENCKNQSGSSTTVCRADDSHSEGFRWDSAKPEKGKTEVESEYESPSKDDAKPKQESKVVVDEKLSKTSRSMLI